ncbi:MAG: hypothetical protein WBD45_14195 [Terriglobales bacterium]
MELRPLLFRTLSMRFRFAPIFCFGIGFGVAVVFFSGRVLAQDAGPVSPVASTPAALNLKPVDLNPVDLKPDASGAVPVEQIRELLRRAEEKDIQNDKQQRDYTYVERDEQHHLDGHGAVKKTESRTSEVLEIYGEPVERLTAKDDKPLPADEAKKEDEKIQKIIDKRKNESEEARRKRLARDEKEREDDRKFVLEVADAFNFRLVGSEVVDGHDTWVLDGEPRPGYEPKSREAKMLSKVKGRIWIDKAEAQWVKLDITTLDTISFGLVLARIHKGTRVQVELTHVNDEVWLPKRVQAHVDLRLALFKNYDEDVEQVYRDYKKFRTDTKITVVGEENRQ